MLNAEGDSIAPADYVVVLTAGAFSGSDAAERNATVAELVTALDAAGSGAVVAGDFASDRAETASSASSAPTRRSSAAVSTVDNVDQPRRADQHRPGARPRERRHLRQVRHRGGHPAGPAGADLDAMTASSNARLALAGAAAARAALAGATALTAPQRRGALAADELREAPGHPARRPGARRLRPRSPPPSARRPAPGRRRSWSARSPASSAGYDDLAGARPEQARDKGLAGHLAALKAGRVSAGAVKVAGIGAAAVAAALLTRRGHGAGALVDGVLTTGLVAGTANLINLLDLRPGRAGKAGALVAAATLGGPAGGLVAGPLGATRRRPPRGPGGADHAGRLRRQRPGCAARPPAGVHPRPGAARRPAGRGRGAHSGQREGQLHEGHRGDARTA